MGDPLLWVFRDGLSTDNQDLICSDSSAMHLYVHVPFCARRCSYCDFAIAVRREVPSAAFTEAILAEWSRWLTDSRLQAVSTLSTIYFGGGTPSRLHPSELSRLLEGLVSARPLLAGAEVTLEANPEDVTAESATGWRRAGVNRVSLGVQSFDPAVLAWMHRTHTADQVGPAVALLRDAGITNLSLDLIYGLPIHLARDWPRDLDQAVALEPTHLSLYALTVEPSTPLSRWIDRGATVAAGDELQASEFLLAHERLTRGGFSHYEVSNYALPGWEAVHNRAYWARRPYLGLGPSAHSALGSRRWWNLREWEAWRQAVAAGGSPVAGEEQLDQDKVVLEDLYLGLRTDQGVSLTSVPHPIRAAWLGQGWARVRGERLYLLPEGWLRLDALVGQASAG
jgi:oxygen-independent coproporphyrinogen-3 oxidase